MALPREFGVRPFRRVGKRCDNGQPCGFLAPCQNGVCTPSVCLIGDQIVQPADTNPDNPCQFCIPTVDGWRTWLGTVGDGEACEFDDEIPCQSTEGVCQNVECIRNLLPDASECGLGGICCSGACCEDGNCCCIGGQSVSDGTLQTPGGCLTCNIDQSITEWTVLDDNTGCGGVSGRVCCNAECCSPTECCTGAACEECGPHCHIGTEDVGAGIEHPDNECEHCDPERDFDSWSQKDPGSPCGLGDLQECCLSRCCPLGECCDEGSCGACFCLIEGDKVRDGDDHPTEKCLKCSYGENPEGWSPQPNNIRCGSGDDRLCCDGECCPAGQYCTLDGCTDYDCFILGVPVAEDQDKPGNSCETCQSNRDRFDWTPLDDGDACGPNDNSECCNGACCPEGQCCENGVCQRCPCEIGTDKVPADVVNLDNICQKCIPELNRFGWSPVAQGTACGDDLTGACCGMDCCPESQCCLLEACGECLCAVDEGNVAAETPHPTIDCLECKPELDPFGWSTADDGDVCGETDSQRCCGGDCCLEGECCIDGACQSEHPDNECLVCDPSRDPLGWSPLDENAPCGEADELCCKAGACTLCGCMIDGVPYEDGKENPLNECEHCDLALDAVRWSPRGETFTCGASDTQICCNGFCCDPGQRCNLEDVCEPRPCEIDGITVEPFQRNPQDACQLCDPALSTTAWSNAPDGDPCGPSLDQTCCGGVCGACEPGCFIDGVRYDDGQPRPGPFSCDACNALSPQRLVATRPSRLPATLRDRRAALSQRNAEPGQRLRGLPGRICLERIDRAPLRRRHPELLQRELLRSRSMLRRRRGLRHQRLRAGGMPDRRHAVSERHAQPGQRLPIVPGRRQHHLLESRGQRRQFVRRHGPTVLLWRRLLPVGRLLQRRSVRPLDLPHLRDRRSPLLPRRHQPRERLRGLPRRHQQVRLDADRKLRRLSVFPRPFPELGKDGPLRSSRSLAWLRGERQPNPVG